LSFDITQHSCKISSTRLDSYARPKGEKMLLFQFAGLIVLLLALLIRAFSPHHHLANRHQHSSSRLHATPQVSTFREAEILGLKLMQQGDYSAALQGKSIKPYCC
jgi:hypothetical protein